MKCPKCGFNSFEYYDSCKKCANDLTGYKQTYAITQLVLPGEARMKLVSEPQAPVSLDDPHAPNSEQNADMFAFSMNDDTASATATANGDPFNFDDSTSEDDSKTEVDPFADLLESTSQTAASPFGETATSEQAVSAQTATIRETGEFDLESFSWDDELTVSSSDGTAGDEDNFDSLFGDATEKKSQ